MTETGRFYSSIRRIPTTLYRLPDGTRVPGGPYTLVQGVGGAITVASAPGRGTTRPSGPSTASVSSTVPW